MPEVSPEVVNIITKKKQSYCRYADTHQWHLFTKLAVPECTYEFRQNGKLIEHAGASFKWTNTEGFISFFRKSSETLQTIHLAGPGHFEQVSDDEVKAVFPVIFHSAPKPGVSKGISVTGERGGYYHETYRRTGDDWLMSHLVMDKTYGKDD